MAEPKCVRWCRTFVLVFVHRLDGHPIVWEKPCESWLHEPCAVDRATRWLGHMRPLFLRSEMVWFGSAPDDRAVLDRIKQRRKEHDGQYVAIQRTDGTVHIFSDCALDGRKPPTDGSILPVRDAYDLLRAGSLSLPGVSRVSASRGWAMPRRDPNPLVARIGATSRRNYERAHEIAATELEVRTGTRRERGRPLRSDIVPLWIELLAHAVAFVKLESERLENLA